MIFLLSLLAARSAGASTPQINVYSSSYAPVKGTTITITAQFADANGIPTSDPFAPTTVNWTLTGGGSLSSSSTVTSGLGIATVTLTVSASSGVSCTVTAAATGYTSGTSNTITTINAAGAAAGYVVTSSSYSPVLSNGVTITAQLVDANNNNVSAVKTVTWSKFGTGGSFSSGTSTTNASGAATVTFTAGATMTTYIITGNDGTSSGSSAAISTEQSAPAAADTLTTPADYVDYAEIQNLFNNNCIGCHSPTGGQTPHYDAASGSYANIVNVTSSNPSYKYILPSDAANSLIPLKVHQNAPPVGSRMPFGGPNLVASDQQLFRDWTNEGAHKPAASFTVTYSGSTVAGSVMTVNAQLLDAGGSSLHAPGVLVNWTTTGPAGAFSNSATRTNAAGIATTTFTTGPTAGQSYSFTGTSGSLTGTSSSFTTVAGAATQYLVTSNNYNPVAGNSVTISAQLADVHGNAVAASRSVTWSYTNTSGSGTSTFAANPTNTNAATGLATVVLTTPASAVTLTVTANDGSQSGTSAGITTKPAQYLISYTPVGAVSVGQTITVKAQLADGGGTPIMLAGQNVTLSVSGVGGSFVPSTAQLTDASGKVTASFTSSTTAGSLTISATDGASNGSLAITNNPGPATKYVLATPSAPVAGATASISAQLADTYGNAVSGAKTVTWSVTAGPTGSFLQNPTNTDAATGLATTNYKVSTTAGTFTISATDGTNSGSLAVTSKAGPAAKYVFTTVPTSITVGTNNVSVIAHLSDQYGNLVSGTGTVTWAVIGVGGSFSSNTSPVIGGSASINFNAPTTVGTDNISANDGTYSGTSPTITIQAGTPNKYILTSTTLSPVAGSFVQVTAKLADSFGNLLTSYTGPMNWTNTGAGGSFSNSTNVVNGVATTTFTTSTTAGTVYTVKGTDGNLLSGAVTLTSVAGPPTQCVLLVAPNNPTVGTAVTVNGQLQDANNNNVTTPGVVIIWSANFSGIFQNATTTTSASGQVSNNFTTGPVAGLNYIISATDGAAINSSSAIFTSVAGAPGAYRVTVSNSAPAAGTGITATAQLTDALGNALPVLGQTVTWSLSGTTGSFSAPTSVTNASGVATITYTTSTVSGDTEKIIATTGVTIGTSTTVTTVPGAGAKYVVTASTTSVAAGVGVRIAAALVDAHGNAAPTVGNSVAWSTTGTNGFFSTPSSTTDSTGTAYVVLSTSPTGGVSYVVTALDSGGLTGSSPQIKVAAFTGTVGVSPIITSPLSATTGAGASFSYTVTAMGDQPITFNVTSLPPGLVFSGDTITGSLGVAGTFIAHVTATNAAGSDAIDLLITSAPALNLSLDKARLKLVFTSQGGDSLAATFSLTLPDGETAQNSTMSIQFGGASFPNLVPSSKSKGNTSVSIKPMAKGSSSVFVSLKVTGANLKTLLAANGLVNDNVSHVPVSLPMQIIITTIDSQTFYCSGNGVLTYAATKGKIGIGTK
jgi:hypothetical protein